jgi:hypothetical protein
MLVAEVGGMLEVAEELVAVAEELVAVALDSLKSTGMPRVRWKISRETCEQLAEKRR